MTIQRTSSRPRRRWLWAVLALLILLAAVTGLLLSLRPDVRTQLETAWIQWREELPLREQACPADSLSAVPLAAAQAGETSLTWNQNLLLVNADHPLQEKLPLTLFGDTGLSVSPALVEPFTQLIEDVRSACDQPLYILSSYRTPEEQAQEYAENPETAAQPGESEHETGLALDVYTYQYAGAGFLKSPAGRLVNQEGWKRGFIIRYPAGKQAITGIPFEPWHIRYVGAPHAEILFKNDWTLEEYLDELELGKFYAAGDRPIWISRQDAADGKLYIPPESQSVSVSPDNTGSYILTISLS